MLLEPTERQFKMQVRQKLHTELSVFGMKILSLKNIFFGPFCWQTSFTLHEEISFGTITPISQIHYMKAENGCIIRHIRSCRS